MSTDAIHYETLSGFTPLSTLGPYRAADYWQLPEGEPVELLRGRFVVSPAPDLSHQTIVGVLHVLLFSMPRERRPRVYGPRRRRPRRTLDSATRFALRAEGATQHFEEPRDGAPDLVVEILSPHNSRRDRVDKLNLYAQYGVAEYWIVDPIERQFDFLVNRGGKFEVQPQQDDRYTSPVCPELAVDLAAFWRSVDEELSPE